MQSLWIPHTLPSINEMLDLKASGWKGKYNANKKAFEESLYFLCINQGIRRVERASFRFLWVERNRRRDPDGIVAGGRKWILDGLVRARRLPGDGWKHVLGFQDEWEVDPKNPGVRVLFWDPTEKKRVPYLGTDTGTPAKGVSLPQAQRSLAGEGPWACRPPEQQKRPVLRVNPKRRKTAIKKQPKTEEDPK